MMTIPASASTSRRVQGVMGALMLGVGIVGTIAPNRLSGTSASEPGSRSTDTVAERHHLTQMYSMREAALGAILVSGAGAKSVLAATIGLTAVEVATALRSPALDARTRTTTALSASLFGVVAAYALTGAGAQNEH
ncbi:hypothetical protein [Mycolicibacterium litorale]|uniref:DUF4267 domain-containing protein n=1 Tax=Mycolicibacterium litorale TaxID=758802 RepID=A0AAD1MRV8_9MYCO|nr:hypothetical protein [Mycolicibacterium litorale]MCV7415454.1 hypothetical protein [Mycolicibacterium litorale]TDY08709.1 hypothetical protein BCL50_0780 [Mycolicibacterium litorale]BBY16634.1 hypothetical protein MLIT_22260 [Mycolicibacterium litorale]